MNSSNVPIRRPAIPGPVLAFILALTLALTAATGGPVHAGPATGRDRLVLGLPLEPPNLDPTAGAAAAVDEVVYGNVFEGLSRITQNGTVAPALAESWAVAPDGLVWVFHLRSGVRFHDGSTFDAQDVKFSLDRMLVPGSANAQAALFQPIRTVTVVDPLTVRITLDQCHPTCGHRSVPF